MGSEYYPLPWRMLKYDACARIEGENDVLHGLKALGLAGLLLFGTSHNAGAAPPNQQQETAAPAKRVAPLPPGRAAGIRQAQGEGGGLLLGAAVTGGIFLAMILLIDGDDSVTTVTTD